VERKKPPHLVHAVVDLCVSGVNKVEDVPIAEHLFALSAEPFAEAMGSIVKKMNN
jgi:hypothetical protein